MSFNKRKGYLFVYAPATPIYSLTGLTGLICSDLYYLGRVKSEGGYSLKADEKIKLTDEEEKAATFKIEVKFEGLDDHSTTDLKTYVDNKTKALVIVEDDDMVDPDDAAILTTLETILAPGDPEQNLALAANIIVPMRLHLEEDVKLGGGKVVPWMINGSKVVPSKADAIASLTTEY